MPANAERSLLFGLIALQVGLIDQAELVAAFQAWARDKTRPLAEHLGSLDAEGRAAVEAMVSLHLRKHGGDIEKGLASLPVGRSTRERLTGLGDADLDASLTLVTLAEPASDDESYLTRFRSVGGSTSDGLRFRVLRPHARGGLGAVFVALDDELHREVALKQILDDHADDPSSRQRFVIEAEITGGLEHPGIVPVYGLGAYSDGRPYYAMRFIKGDSLKDAITRFHNPVGSAVRTDPDIDTIENVRTADPTGLELRKLLRRFLDVCNAIHYAHARGVLHRDIKPGNIIIGKYGETLVVDWGLAKARGRAEPESAERPLAPASSSGSVETQAGIALGTPHYMSPEQARGALDQLDARSDVYSLGATLHHLLTGKPPFSGTVEEVLRAVERGEFPRPRQLDPTIDPALEAVCLKAMAMRPEERYPSAKALADDVERWLADEPTVAYPEPFTRRARRWMKRNRTAVSAAIVALVMGFAAALYGYQRERTYAKKLEAANAEAIDAVKKFGDAVADNPELEDNPSLVSLRKTLLKEPLAFFRSLRDRLQADRDTRPESLARLAGASYELGHLTDEIGDKRDALTLYRGSLAIVDRLARAEPTITDFQSKRADLHLNIGVLLSRTGQTAEALAAYEKARAISERLAEANPKVAQYHRGLAASHNNIGEIQSETGQTEAAFRSYEQARVIQERLVRENPDITEFQSKLAIFHNNIGRLQRATGKREAALRSYEQARAIRERLARAEPADSECQNELGACHYYIGLLQSETGQAAAALRSLEQARAIWERLVEKHPSVTKFQRDLASSHHDIGRLQKALGQTEAALRSYGQARAIDEGLVRVNPSVTEFQSSLANTHNNIGNLQLALGQNEAAMISYEQALTLLGKLARENPDITQFQRSLARTHNGVGALQRTSGKMEEALRSLEQARGIRQKLAEANPNVVESQHELAGGHNNLGVLLREMGRPDEALAAHEQARAIDERLAREHPESPDFSSSLGGLLNNMALIDIDAKRFDAARDRLQQAIVWQKKALGVNPRNPTYRQFLANHLGNLIAATRTLGRDDEAAAAQRELAELKATDPRFTALNARLAAVLKGEAPKDDAERLALAQRAYDLDRHAAAAKLWAEALAADPKLADDRQAGHRYNAACAAALAAAGKGQDDPAPDEAAKSKLRQQALDWLKAELAIWAKFVESGPPQAKAFIAQTLKHWQEDTDLAGIRDAKPLEALPESERAAWRELWASVDALLAKATSAPELPADPFAR